MSSIEQHSHAQPHGRRDLVTRLVEMRDALIERVTNIGHEDAESDHELARAYRDLAMIDRLIAQVMAWEGLDVHEGGDGARYERRHHDDGTIGLCVIPPAPIVPAPLRLAQ